MDAGEAWMSNRRARRAMLVLLALAVTGLVPSEAHAYVFGGQTWPSHVIPYYDAGPNHAAVRAAVHAWNTSGVNLRFVPTSRARARLLIVPLKPAGCYGVEGFGTLGYSPLGDKVQLRPCPNQVEDVITAAHELGHVLGLNHELHRCATMSASGGEFCKRPPIYSQLCRVLQPDDVRGAVARYGGVVRPIRSPQFCPEFTPPAAPHNARISGQAPPADQLTAHMHVARERRLIAVPGQAPPYQQVDVYRYARACPVGRPHGQPYGQVIVPASGNVELALDGRTLLAPGPWCYAFWTTDGGGRRSRTATTVTVQVAHTPPVAGFDPPDPAYAGLETDFTDNSFQGDDPITAWSWNFGDGATSTDQYPAHTYAQPGTYTVTLTVTSSYGQTSTIAHQVTVATPPEGYY
jgi:hypothetical protein